jgi:SecD/SecF fusion protein
MQNRNFIKIFAILFAIVSLYQLSFTWVANGVEDDAVAYASQFPDDLQEIKEKS